MRILLSAVLLLTIAIIPDNASANNIESSLTEDEPIKIIIDTDAGGDDAVAIVVALAAEAFDQKVRVMAITCSYGNTEERFVEINVLQTLTVANRTDVPVYRGAEHPIANPSWRDDEQYMGPTGFGTVSYSHKGKALSKEPAYISMAEIVNEYPGEISIVVLGPTTNVALAIQYDSNFVTKVKKFYVKGGWKNFPQNQPEYNFGMDPEANKIFLNSLPEDPDNVKAVVVPKEITTPIQYQVPKSWRQTVISGLNTAVVKFLDAAESTTLLGSRNYWSCADSLNLVLAVWPDVVKNRENCSVSAITNGNHRGQTHVDCKGAKQPNVQFITDFEVEKFKDTIKDYLSELKKKN